MIIVHINTEVAWGGGEAQTCYLIRGLQAQGLQNILIAPPQSSVAERVRELGVEVIELAMRGEWDIPAVVRLTAILRRVKPDVLQLHTSHAHALGLLAGRLAGSRPIVATRRMDHEIKGLLSRRKYCGPDQVVAISEVIRALLIKGGVPPERTSVIYSAVDCTDPYPQGDLRAELGLDERGPVIGTVAVLNERKGHRSLFKAVSMLKPRFPQVRLIVAGTGPLEPQLREMAGTLGLEEAILFLGFRRDIPQVLNTLDVFVLASQKEGLGVALLEAACRGLPIVATRVGGIPEIIEDRSTGLLVPPDDPQSLAEGLQFLIEHPEEGKRLGRNARQYVRDHFSVEAMVAQYISLYEKLTQRHGPPS